jgi:hypothetical protein
MPGVIEYIGLESYPVSIGYSIDEDSALGGCSVPCGNPSCNLLYFMDIRKSQSGMPE